MVLKFILFELILVRYLVKYGTKLSVVRITFFYRIFEDYLLKLNRISW